jgi:putative effector of murein hydrolase LrgA (UPF0299 family)
LENLLVVPIPGSLFLGCLVLFTLIHLQLVAPQSV